MDDAPDERELRASDADRDQFAEVVRQAAADGRLSLTELDERIDALYSAKTYGELDAVVRDLPGSAAVAPPPARVDRPANLPARRVGGKGAHPYVKAIFSAMKRRGEWVVPKWSNTKAVFGEAVIDLTEATLEQADVRMDMKAVFGKILVVVPDDVHVVVDGSAVFGEFVDRTLRQPGSGAPVVRIGGKAVFGQVEVVRQGAT